MNGALTKYECLYTFIREGGIYSKRFGVVPEGSALEGKVIAKVYAVQTMNNFVSLIMAREFNNKLLS